MTKKELIEMIAFYNDDDIIVFDFDCYYSARIEWANGEDFKEGEEPDKKDLEEGQELITLGRIISRP